MLVGDIVIPSLFCATITVTVLATDKPPASVMTTLNPYVPALGNVTVVFLAALEPLMENDGNVVNAGAEVETQV